MEDQRESLSLDSKLKHTNKPLLKVPMEPNTWEDKSGSRLLPKEDKDLLDLKVNKEQFLMTQLLFLSEI